mmetsp:Transcript_12156/g.36580  ORF Transcript_12156/g.36580 Transcript_12156/m.36580 type:complete len:159 (+) Transcript_12156:5457-5933(+)
MVVLNFLSALQYHQRHIVFGYTSSAVVPVRLGLRARTAIWDPPRGWDMCVLPYTRGRSSSFFFLLFSESATPEADNLEVGAKLCEADNAPSVIFRRRIQAWARARAWTQRTSPLGKSCVKFDHHEIHALFGGESFGWGRGPARKILTDLRRLGENILA